MSSHKKGVHMAGRKKDIATTKVAMEVEVPDLRPNVAKGVAVLDQKVPGWWRKVKVTELNMIDGDDCVLGQLTKAGAFGESKTGYGWGYTHAVKVLMEKEDPTTLEIVEYMEDHGFDTPSYGRLTEWIDGVRGYHPWKGQDIEDTVSAYLGEQWKEVIRSKKKATAKAK